MSFQIGDKVVYPNQGVGIVEQISTRNLTGQPEMFYLLRLASGSMRVIVPISSVVNVGLRRVTRTSDRVARVVGARVISLMATVASGRKAFPSSYCSHGIRRKPRSCARR